MVRRRSTIEKMLKKINKIYFKKLNKGYWYRFFHKKELQELQAKSEILAWVLNKINHYPPGGKYACLKAKK